MTSGTVSQEYCSVLVSDVIEAKDRIEQLEQEKTDLEDDYKLLVAAFVKILEADREAREVISDIDWWPAAFLADPNGQPQETQ